MSVRLSGLTREKVEGAVAESRFVPRVPMGLYDRWDPWDDDQPTRPLRHRPHPGFRHRQAVGGLRRAVPDFRRGAAASPACRGRLSSFSTASSPSPASRGSWSAGATVTAEYDVPADAWYFAAGRQPQMPFSVLLETGLQPCGWLAAYLGSALTSPIDLSFRNLDGRAVQHRPVTPESGTLTTQVKITRIASSGGMIIQGYDFEIQRPARAGLRRRYRLRFLLQRNPWPSRSACATPNPGSRPCCDLAGAESFPYPQAAPFPAEQAAHGRPHRCLFCRTAVRMASASSAAARRSIRKSGSSRRTSTRIRSGRVRWGSNRSCNC